MTDPDPLDLPNLSIAAGYPMFGDAKIFVNTQSISAYTVSPTLQNSKA